MFEIYLFLLSNNFFIVMLHLLIKRNSFKMFDEIIYLQKENLRFGCECIFFQFCQLVLLLAMEIYIIMIMNYCYLNSFPVGYD